MADTQDPYDQLSVVDAVQESVGAAAGAELDSQFSAERLSDTVRCASEVSERELDDRGKDARREPVEVAPSGSFRP